VNPSYDTTTATPLTATTAPVAARTNMTDSVNATDSAADAPFSAVQRAGLGAVAAVILFVIIAAGLHVTDSDQAQAGARHRLAAVTPAEPGVDTQAGIDRLATQAEQAQDAAMNAAVSQQQAAAQAAAAAQQQQQADSLSALSSSSASSREQLLQAQALADADTVREQGLVRDQGAATAAGQAASADAVAAQAAAQSQNAAAAAGAAAAQRLASCLVTAAEKWGTVGLAGSLGQQQDEEGCRLRFGAP
jgi:hypothetical protein